MAAVVTDDALGLAGGPRGVEHVQRIGGGDGNGVDGFGVGHRVRPRHVAAGHERARALFALHDDARRRVVSGLLERGVEHRLVVDDAGGLDAARRGDHDGRAGIVDARGQLVRGEAAEHHRVHGAQSRAGQHRDDGFGHHRQVDDHPVALADAQAAQRAGEAGGLV